MYPFKLKKGGLLEIFVQFPAHFDVSIFRVGLPGAAPMLEEDVLPYISLKRNLLYCVL